MRVRLIQGAGWRTESCTGCSNRCVHAHRPVPCVLVCLLGPSRQQSAGLSRASHGQFCHRLAGALFHRDTASCQGSASRIRDMSAAVPLWTPAPPQRGWLTCASVPTPLEQWPLCAGRRRAVSWSAMAARIRAVFPSPHRPASAATRTLHISAASLPHTYVQPITRSRTHRAANTQPSAVRRRAAVPCSPFFAQSTRAASEQHFYSIWDEG